MSAWLVALCGVIYIMVALDQAVKAQWWMSLLYAGYALANVGAVMLVVKGVRP